MTLIELMDLVLKLDKNALRKFFDSSDETIEEYQTLAVKLAEILKIMQHDPEIQKILDEK